MLPELAYDARDQWEHFRFAAFSANATFIGRGLGRERPLETAQNIFATHLRTCSQAGGLITIEAADLRFEMSDVRADRSRSGPVRGSVSLL
jgi:hypothetical protein